MNTINDLRSRAKRGDAEAWVKLGMYFRDGVRSKSGRLLMSPHARRARACFQNAARLGAAAGLVALANDFADRGDTRRSLALNRRAWRLGDPTGGNNAAIDLRRMGRHAQAFRIFRVLASGGSDTALLQVAKAELFGVGTRRNSKLALKHFEQVARPKRGRDAASVMDREEAMLRIADALIDGILVPIDFRSALKWLRLAAKGGSDLATARLKDLNND